MPGKKRLKNRKPTQAATITRAMLIRRSRQKKNVIGIDLGEVTNIDRKTATIEFKPVVGNESEPFAREFPTWRLRAIKADFIGAKVKHAMFWLGHGISDMIVSRLTRVGPTLSLKVQHSARRLTKADWSLLDHDSPREPE